VLAVKKSHVTLKCYWKGKMLLSTCVKISSKKRHSPTIKVLKTSDFMKVEKGGVHRKK